MQNVNDTQWRRESLASTAGSSSEPLKFAGTEARGVQAKEGREYKQWVWKRCCPGLDFTGELPPVLEVRTSYLSLSE